MATKQNKRYKTNSNSHTGNTTRKKVGRPKSTSNKKYTNQKGKDHSNNAVFHDEITLVITLVISLLLLLSNFNLSGKVGDLINSFTFGFIGYLAYLLPIFLFFGVAFYIANRGNREAIHKLVSILLVFIVLSALIQLIFSENIGSGKIIDFYQSSAKAKNGGGVIGGIVCKLLYPLFGTVGSYVILFALLIVCLMFITGKTLFAYLGRKSKDSLDLMMERKQQRAEERSMDNDDDEAELVERRPARTVLLKKKEKETKKATKINAKKASSKQNGDHVFDMKEIQSEGADHISIQRAGYDPDGLNKENKNKTYEEQLKMKFGNASEDTTAAVTDVNQERPGLDEDIQRLLHAAGQDMVEEQISPVTPLEAPSMEVANTKKSVSTAKMEPSDLEQLSKKQVITDNKEYVFPPINLLSKPKMNAKGTSDKDLKETAIKLQKTLESFGVRVTITNVSCGPAVTRYELQPEQGVKVSRITGLADDIKLNLAAADVRIEAPIPGKAAVGIEVPNKDNTMVMFREIIENKNFTSHPSDIAFAVGKDIGGQTVVTDIAKMPHLLIAGATGSGKSVCINTLIMSILYKAKPSEVRMIMVDPKVVELSVYNGIPHLLIPVVTDPKKASAALNWAVMEMTERYSKFADLGVRDIKGYNEKVATVAEYQNENYQKLPQIVIIVDELADLMMVAPGEVEDSICRLAQMARAAGLHLIIATQRPSVNVITGLIKANIPSRIAFSVSSSIDSRTIIDGSGAEKLLGKGDMLFFPSGYPKPIRVQGAFVSDKEVSAVVEFLSKNSSTEYSEDIANKITSVQATESAASSPANDRDDYFLEAGKFIIEKDKASIGMLQRVYKIGFNRAARIMDQLADVGVVGPEEGTKPRKVLMSLEEFEQYMDEYV